MTCDLSKHMSVYQQNSLSPRTEQPAACFLGGKSVAKQVMPRPQSR